MCTCLSFSSAFPLLLQNMLGPIANIMRVSGNAVPEWMFNIAGKGSGVRRGEHVPRQPITHKVGLLEQREQEQKRSATVRRRRQKTRVAGSQLHLQDANREQKNGKRGRTTGQSQKEEKVAVKRRKREKNVK